jgi:phospholipid transport system substrate-binding protein
MFTSSNAAQIVSPDLGRRALLGFLVVGAASLGRPAFAAYASADPITIISRFNEDLVAAMKSGQQTPFSRRFQALAPAVDQAFDLSAVLALSVGPGWASLAPDQQTRLLSAFRSYTVASYVANFDNYSGQNFTVSPDTSNVGADQVIVHSRITPVSGNATELDYVVKQTSAGWKVVDVLAAGSISRVAVQRSDFRHLLTRGGGDALLSSLQRKTSDLSGGSLA